MKFIDYCASQEGQDLLLWGIEGQDWEFDYETFVKWDKAHPGTKTKAAPMGEPAGEEIEPVPPVMLGKTWRQVMKK